MPTRQDILGTAEDTYDQLKAYFNVSDKDPFLNNWWRAGNCFDTMTDCFRWVRPGSPDEELLKDVLAKYEAVQGSAC